MVRRANFCNTGVVSSFVSCGAITVENLRAVRVSCADTDALRIVFRTSERRRDLAMVVAEMQTDEDLNFSSRSEQTVN